MNIGRLPITGNEAKSVKAPVKKLLTKHGWFWWSPPANGYGATGVSDIHAIKTGMFMVIETKFGRNDPTVLQHAFLESVRAEDHFAWIVRETTLDAFAAFLLYLDKSIEVSGTGAVPGADIGGPLMDASKRMIDTEILNAKDFVAAQARAERKKQERKAQSAPIMDEVSD